MSKLVRVSDRGTVSLGNLAQYEYYMASNVEKDGVEEIRLIPVAVQAVKKEKK